MKFGILNLAIHCRSSLSLVQNMLDVGGEEIVLKQKNALVNLLLNFANLNNHASAKMPIMRDIIKKLIVLGNYSTLFEFFTDLPAIERLFGSFCDDEETIKMVVSVVIEGGRDAVMRQELSLRDEKKGQSILHHYLVMLLDFEDCPSSIIDATKDLLHIGGKDLVLLKNGCGRSVLTAQPSLSSVETIDLLLQTGGKDLVKSQDNEG